jgi:hypothetical protein
MWPGSQPRSTSSTSSTSTRRRRRRRHRPLATFSTHTQNLSHCDVVPHHEQRLALINNKNIYPSAPSGPCQHSSLASFFLLRELFSPGFFLKWRGFTQEHVQRGGSRDPRKRQLRGARGERRFSNGRDRHDHHLGGGERDMSSLPQFITEEGADVYCLVGRRPKKGGE